MCRTVQYCLAVRYKLIVNYKKNNGTVANRFTKYAAPAKYHSGNTKSQFLFLSLSRTNERPSGLTQL